MLNLLNNATRYQDFWFSNLEANTITLLISYPETVVDVVFAENVHQRMNKSRTNRCLFIINLNMGCVLGEALTQQLLNPY